MNEFTALYGMATGGPLPVVIHADTMGEALVLFAAWRGRLSPVADTLVTREPLSVTNDTLSIDPTHGI